MSLSAIDPAHEAGTALRLLGDDEDEGSALMW